VGEAGGERGRGQQNHPQGAGGGGAVAEVALAGAVLHVHFVRARPEHARLGVVLRGQVAARTHHSRRPVHCKHTHTILATNDNHSGQTKTD